MRYDELTTLAELQVCLERESGTDEPGYEAARAFNRLAPRAGFTQANEIFERWQPIRLDSRARYILINLAIDDGRPDEGRRLLEDYEHETDDRATWTAWTGGSTLRYFQARLRLPGHDRYALFAGARYREFLEPLLAAQGAKIQVPMEGLTQGRQLNWLDTHEAYVQT